MNLREIENRFYDSYPHSGVFNQKRYKLMEKLLGTSPEQAFFVLHHLQHSIWVDGVVCEFGVAQGATSALIANELLCSERQKNLMLFDSFVGLGTPSEKDVLINDIFKLSSIDEYKGTMACKSKEVKDRLKEIQFPSSMYRIIKTDLEKINKKRKFKKPKKICFAYIDLDFYEPTVQVMKFVSKRLPVQGTMVIDDYKFFTDGPRAAVKEFMDVHNGEFSLSVRSNQAAIRRLK